MVHCYWAACNLCDGEDAHTCKDCENYTPKDMESPPIMEEEMTDEDWESYLAYLDSLKAGEADLADMNAEDFPFKEDTETLAEGVESKKQFSTYEGQCYKPGDRKEYNG
jgi:RNA polymerase subunit RPABC4/transcription elongation factor Spt4